MNDCRQGAFNGGYAIDSDTTFRFARAVGRATFCLAAASDVRAAGSGRFDFEIACQVANRGDAAFASTRRGQGIALDEIRHGESEGHRLHCRRFPISMPAKS